MDDIEQLLATAAADLNDRRLSADLEVLVEKRWSGPFRAQGLCAYNLWTDVFEPVRRRLPWTKRWALVQPPEDAARKIEWFLVHRPDWPERLANDSRE